MQRVSYLKKKNKTHIIAYLCLVLLQVPKCFELVQIFCARPKMYLHIVVVTNILCQTKRWFAFSKIGFCAGTQVFEEALNAVKFLGWLKKFGLPQNILGPVKGQGTSVLWGLISYLYFVYPLYWAGVCLHGAVDFWNSQRKSLHKIK